MPVYALVAGRTGPKFKNSAPGATPGMIGSVGLTMIASAFIKSQMNSRVHVLSSATDRPVLDQTGLIGLYDYKLEFARDPAAAADKSSASSILTAIQEQLGLKLLPQKGSI